MLLVNCPTVCLCLAKWKDILSIIGRVANARTAPVLSIDEVGTFEGFLLVSFHLSVAHESRVEVVALRMSDDEIYIGSIHPFCK